jgi:L-threonine kinase
VRDVLTRMPGACGELFQGTLEGIPCLISCPVELFTEIELRVCKGSGCVSAPPAMPKTKLSLQIAMKSMGWSDVDVYVKQLQRLPIARGYASSTADILAALFGLSQLLEEPLSAREATQFALMVEPTDSIAWKELTLLAHRDGRIMEPICLPPPIHVLVLDWGGFVDTLQFNQTDYFTTLTELAPQHREAYMILRNGLEHSDFNLIGEAATLSAMAHQRILHKPHLEAVVRLVKSVHALGVCAAHSGTILGILLDPKKAEESAAEILPQLPGEPRSQLCKMAHGGPRYSEEPT